MILSNQFIRSHLYDDNAGYVKDTIELDDCGYASDSMLAYNTGLYLEALCASSNRSDLVDSSL